MPGILKTSPPDLNQANHRASMPAWFVSTSTLMGCCLVFILWSQWNFASYSFALKYLQGSRIQLRTPLKQVGIHRPGDHFETEVRITNHGSAPATILGALADCSCVATQNLPKTIAPGETAALPVRGHFGSTLGEWRQLVTYLTDDSRQPALDVDLIGRVESH